MAASLVLFAMVCDGIDGRVARITGTTSRFGIELDSLADVISFGIAPAVLLYWGLGNVLLSLRTIRHRSSGLVRPLER